MENLKLMLAKMVLHKYLPVQHLVKGWQALSGYRTVICAVLWAVVFELGKYQVGIFADPAFTTKALEGLAGAGSVTLIEKFKGWMPLVEEGIDTAVKESKKT